MLINNIDLADVYELNLVSVEVTTPVAKTSYIEIPGRDEPLDLTEYFGEIKYKNRIIKLVYRCKKSREDYYATFNLMQNAFNGRKVRLNHDDDIEAYFLGRCAVGGFKSDTGKHQIDISIDAEAYRYKNNITSVTQTGTGVLNLNNWQKRVAPRIINTAECKIPFGDVERNISPGTWESKFYLEEGNNEVEITTTGTVTFEYQERGL